MSINKPEIIPQHIGPERLTLKTKPLLGIYHRYPGIQFERTNNGRTRPAKNVGEVEGLQQRDTLITSSDKYNSTQGNFQNIRCVIESHG